SAAQLAEPLDRAGQRELRAAESLDEVAAPAGADGLERPELAVDGPVAAGDPLRTDPVARDDSLSLEQELGQRPAIGGRPTRCEQARGERPESRRRDLAGAARAGETPWAALRGRHPVATFRAERRPRVVRHLARPDELPQRGQR